jgi:hypothetical protein
MTNDQKFLREVREEANRNRGAYILRRLLKMLEEERARRLTEGFHTEQTWTEFIEQARKELYGDE